MPTAKNRFQILNLHPKKHVLKKKKKKKNLVLNEKITELSDLLCSPLVIRSLVKNLNSFFQEKSFKFAPKFYYFLLILIMILLYSFFAPKWHIKYIYIYNSELTP